MNNLSCLVTGFNARERVNNGTMKTMLGLQSESGSCVEGADFNPYYIKANIFVLFLFIKINI
jgi:hypothetical protein